jgi:hypothetical protein
MSDSSPSTPFKSVENAFLRRFDLVQPLINAVEAFVDSVKELVHFLPQLLERLQHQVPWFSHYSASVIFLATDMARRLQDYIP